jgi:hypothetical protein
LLSLFIIVEGLLGIKVKVEFFFLSFALAYSRALLILSLAFTSAFLTFFLTSSFKFQPNLQTFINK